MLQRTVFINKFRMLQRTQMLQRTNATTNSFLSINSGRYNEHRCYNKRMLQRIVFINKFRILQRIQMLQRTRNNTINWRSTRVCMTCRAFPLWIERQSSYLLSFVMFNNQFSSVICAFSSGNIFCKLFCYIILAMSQQNTLRKLDGNFAVGCGPGTD